jgi:hypothetical protein
MNFSYAALKNLKRKPTRTLLLFAIMATVSCTLFAATVFLKSINNALRIGTSRLGADILLVPEGGETKVQTALISGEPTQFRRRYCRAEERHRQGCERQKVMIEQSLHRFLIHPAWI